MKACDYMKAKCPRCQTGCQHCKDGFVEVRFATGVTYTRKCNSCGECNGGRIVTEAHPLPSEKPDPCVFCNSEDMVWLKIGS